MPRYALRALLMGGSAALVISGAAQAAARNFDIPKGELKAALDAYAAQTGVQLVYPADQMKGVRTAGVTGSMDSDAALARILAGTPFVPRHDESGAIAVVRESQQPLQLAQVTRRPQARASGAVETVVVTAEKKTEDIQSVPIAVSAFTQKDLKERQVATGGDLIREVPNMNFGKTNFSGYSIELRGIGTQAISVTTDPAVAVAFNGIPFIRNHFFEQEFFDLGDVEVLRGPQGTLYGRNATAGVVNLVSAKPTDTFEANGSADFGNYSNRRFEGMINLPIVGDKLDLRAAGEWTKRDGYAFNEITNKSIDGRDLWSGRVSLRFKPTEDFEANLVWEHFSEDDDRLRSGKQLCKTAPIPDTVDGVPTGGTGDGSFNPGDFLSQGCLPTSLYSKDAFEVPNGFSLPYWAGLTSDDAAIRGGVNPYEQVVQSTNLRHIESSVPSRYRAKNDIITLLADYKLTPSLTLTSQTGFSQDFLWSTEDYNRFETTPGVFVNNPLSEGRGVSQPDPNAGKNGIPANSGIFCDPQLGCQDRLVVQDLNDEHAWQLSQEFRLASQFDGPLNFSAGANYLHYETEENYFVFINSITQFIGLGNAVNCGMPYFPGNDFSSCLPGLRYSNPNIAYTVIGHNKYIDPNPILSVNGEGHNYFVSKNPYLLNSYALFGEVYYNITDNLKLTGGLRWTDDRKHFVDKPSQILIDFYGTPTERVVDQAWQRFTGRGVLSWTPKLDFTDQTLIYASAARGYKAGGANPPGAIFPTFIDSTATINPTHPLTFKPEYIDAYELGTKNSLLDDTLTLNADVFYYNYQNYQISRIVDRTAINDNFDAHVVGAELESTWEPLPGLSFNLAAGVEDARLANGMKSVDLMDRTAGNPNWITVRPFVTDASNCILPTYVVAALLEATGTEFPIPQACGTAYNAGLDPVTHLPYTPNPTITANGGAPPAGYPGFDPSTAPNDGTGFDKNLSHKEMPNAPPFTLSFGAQYTVPAWKDWTATLRSDFYYQADSWARVFNAVNDRLHGYANLNLALILNSSDGWQAMGYVKNVFDTTAITGSFLNSDDTGLTTNVFLTDPRLFGIRVTKQLNAGDWAPADDVAGWFTDTDGKLPRLWIELGGGLDQLLTPGDRFVPPFMSAVTIPAQRKALDVQNPPRFAFDEEAKVSYQPDDSDWVFSGSIRFGRTGAERHKHQQTKNANIHYSFANPFYAYGFGPRMKYGAFYPSRHVKFADGQSRLTESHTILDFQAGKDVGVGLFGDDRIDSVVSGGLRFVQFNAKSSAALRVEPDVHYTPAAPITNLAGWLGFKYERPPFEFHDFTTLANANRSFQGLGPSGSWDSSLPITGNTEAGELDLDWGLNGALLFGRQKAHGHHQTTTKTYRVSQWRQSFNGGAGYDKLGYFVWRTAVFGDPSYAPKGVANRSVNFTRDRMAVVPDLGASLGLSVKYLNAKVSFGYRADYFFNAMDGGWDTRKSENRGFLGPYAHLTIGLGG